MIALVGTLTSKGVVGEQNQLLFNSSEGRKLLSDIVVGDGDNIVVMGRKTYESIDKTLSNTTNIIVTTDEDYKVENGVVAHSVEEVLRLTTVLPNSIYVVGGKEIYKQFMPVADFFHAIALDDNKITGGHYRFDQMTATIGNEMISMYGGVSYEV